MSIETLFSIIVLIMSVVVHEVSHGYTAYYLGDPTAKYAGRLTLNPLRHLDPFGSVILPLLLVIAQANFIIGWAKPVPFNPHNLSNQRFGEAIVAIAGPISNIALALFFGLFIRLMIALGLATTPLITITSIIVVINIVLALFNMVPIPPLDGSKLLFSVLPDRASKWLRAIEPVGIFIVLLFVMFFWRFFFPLIPLSYQLLTGLPFAF